MKRLYPKSILIRFLVLDSRGIVFGLVAIHWLLVLNLQHSACCSDLRPTISLKSQDDDDDGQAGFFSKNEHDRRDPSRKVNIRHRCYGCGLEQQYIFHEKKFKVGSITCKGRR